MSNELDGPSGQSLEHEPSMWPVCKAHPVLTRTGEVVCFPWAEKCHGCIERDMAGVDMEAFAVARATIFEQVGTIQRLEEALRAFAEKWGNQYSALLIENDRMRRELERARDAANPFS